MNNETPSNRIKTYPGLAFDNLKGYLVSDEVFAYYNVSKLMVILCNSSQSGSGAVLLQNNRSVE